MIKSNYNKAIRPAWQAQKEKLKSNFPQLTDSDLDYDETRRNEMLIKLRNILGKRTQELKSILDSL